MNRLILSVPFALVAGISMLGAQGEPPSAPGVPPPLSPVPAGEPPKLDAETVRKSIKKISETEYELGPMKLDAKGKVLRLPATLNMVKGPLEYLLVSEHGAAHEALFVTKATPFEMNVALLLLGFKPCETFFTKATPEKYPEPLKNPEINQEARIDFWVEWKDEAGADQRVRAESWIHNLKTERAVSDGPWVYNGSFIKEGDLAAQLSGNIASLFLDGLSLLNNPRQGNELDDIWEPAPNLPKKGTAVTLVLQPAAPESGKESPEKAAKTAPEKEPKPATSKPKKNK